MNKTLQIKEKLWFPIFKRANKGMDKDTAQCTNIFGQVLHNASWITLARASIVCKDWHEGVTENYPAFSYYSKILSRQILHLTPMMKMGLALLGDRRIYQEGTACAQVHHRGDAIPTSARMSKDEIQKNIIKFEGPLAVSMQTSLSAIEYGDNNAFSRAIELISRMQYYGENYAIPEQLEHDLAPIIGTVNALIERQKVIDKINNAGLCAKWDLQKLIALFTIVLLVCYFVKRLLI